MIKEWKSVEPYLDTFLIIDPADHPHTHLSNLTEGWLLQTDVSEDLDHPFSHTDTSVLCRKKTIHKGFAKFCKHYIKNKPLLSFTKETSAWGAIAFVCQ